MKALAARPHLSRSWERLAPMSPPHSTREWISPPPVRTGRGASRHRRTLPCVREKKNDPMILCCSWWPIPTDQQDIYTAGGTVWNLWDRFMKSCFEAAPYIQRRGLCTILAACLNQQFVTSPREISTNALGKLIRSQQNDSESRVLSMVTERGHVWGQVGQRAHVWGHTWSLKMLRYHLQAQPSRAQPGVSTSRLDHSKANGINLIYSIPCNSTGTISNAFLQTLLQNPRVVLWTASTKEEQYWMLSNWRKAYPALTSPK